jgi:hypothetical protein
LTAPTRPAFLSLGLSTSAFAINFFLVLSGPFHIVLIP